jgi:tripartite-type tricarboxylate transporter receptor subunit TctC
MRSANLDGADWTGAKSASHPGTADFGKTMRRKIIAALLAGLVQLPISPGAEAFPDRPVKLVVSAPPGSPPDITARVLKDKMTATLGQPVVVENRAGGAGGLIAARSLITAEPDGYTLMIGSTSTVLTAPLIYKNAGYSAETFAPVAGISETAEVLAVNPSVTVHSVADLVNAAKSHPGQLRFGSAGTGSLPHLEGELLKARAQIDMVHVPYRGGGQALVGLLGNEVQIFFSALTQMLPYIRDDRLRGLAVTSASRDGLAPDIPTMVESGFDQFITASINFIVAPPGTPLSVRRRLSEVTAIVLADPEVKETFGKIGARVQPASPEQLSAYLAEQQLRWAKIVKATGISVDE